MQYLQDIPSKEIRPGFFGKFIHGEKGTVAVWNIKKGSVLETHQHDQEQITYIVEGTIDMIIGSEKYTLTAGATHVIPSNIPHSAVAVTDVNVIDFFSPVRNDYR